MPRPKGERPSAADMAKAQHALALLMETIKRWKDIDKLRASLPASHRRRIPPSRIQHVKAILSGLIRKGAVRTNDPELQWVWALAIGVVAVAAAVAVVIAAIPAIKREARRSKQAKQTADQVERLWAVEKQEARTIGPAAAAERRQEREAGIRTLYKAQAELEESGAPAGLGGLPWWVIPAALGVGALVLFGGQKAAPMVARRYLGAA